MRRIDLSACRIYPDPAAPVHLHDDGNIVKKRVVSAHGQHVLDITHFRELKLCDLTGIVAELPSRPLHEAAAAPGAAAPHERDDELLDVDLTEFMVPGVAADLRALRRHGRPTAVAVEPEQVSLPLRQSSRLRQCNRCQEPFAGVSSTCSSCRRVGPRGSQLQCKECGDFFQGHGSSCSACREAQPEGSPAQGVKMAAAGCHSEASTCTSPADEGRTSGTCSGTSAVAAGRPRGPPMPAKRCSSCQALYSGFGNDCSDCRKGARSPRQCRSCQGFSIFSGDHCNDCAKNATTWGEG